ncbi:MAG: hypothetical protein PHQ80_04650, partial [Candidatus ainarchaeum sp.]|nr:hypothetical protein [Candidatus ainarchaeum sp.]
MSTTTKGMPESLETKFNAVAGAGNALGYSPEVIELAKDFTTFVPGSSLTGEQLLGFLTRSREWLDSNRGKTVRLLRRAARKTDAPISEFDIRKAANLSLYFGAVPTNVLEALTLLRIASEPSAYGKKREALENSGVFAGRLSLTPKALDRPRAMVDSERILKKVAKKFDKKTHERALALSRQHLFLTQTEEDAYELLLQADCALRGDMSMHVLHVSNAPSARFSDSVVAAVGQRYSANGAPLTRAALMQWFVEEKQYQKDPFLFVMKALAGEVQSTVPAGDGAGSLSPDEQRARSAAVATHRLSAEGSMPGELLHLSRPEQARALYANPSYSHLLQRAPASLPDDDKAADADAADHGLPEDEELEIDIEVEPMREAPKPPAASREIELSKKYLSMAAEEFQRARGEKIRGAEAAEILRSYPALALLLRKSLTAAMEREVSIEEATQLIVDGPKNGGGVPTGRIGLLKMFEGYQPSAASRIAGLETFVAKEKEHMDAGNANAYSELKATLDAWRMVEQMPTVLREVISKFGDSNPNRMDRNSAYAQVDAIRHVIATGEAIDTPEKAMRLFMDMLWKVRVTEQIGHRVSEGLIPYELAEEAKTAILGDEALREQAGFPSVDAEIDFYVSLFQNHGAGFPAKMVTYLRHKEGLLTYKVYKDVVRRIGEENPAISSEAELHEFIKKSWNVWAVERVSFLVTNDLLSSPAGKKAFGAMLGNEELVKKGGFSTPRQEFMIYVTACRELGEPYPAKLALHLFQEGGSITQDVHGAALLRIIEEKLVFKDGDDFGRFLEKVSGHVASEDLDDRKVYAPGLFGATGTFAAADGSGLLAIARGRGSHPYPAPPSIIPPKPVDSPGAKPGPAAEAVGGDMGKTTEIKRPPEAEEPIPLQPGRMKVVGTPAGAPAVAETGKPQADLPTVATPVPRELLAASAIGAPGTASSGGASGAKPEEESGREPEAKPEPEAEPARPGPAAHPAQQVDAYVTKLAATLFSGKPLGRREAAAEMLVDSADPHDYVPLLLDAYCRQPDIRQKAMLLLGENPASEILSHAFAHRDSLAKGGVLDLPLHALAEHYGDSALLPILAYIRNHRNANTLGDSDVALAMGLAQSGGIKDPLLLSALLPAIDSISEEEQNGVANFAGSIGAAALPLILSHMDANPGMSPGTAISLAKAARGAAGADGAPVLAHILPRMGVMEQEQRITVGLLVGKFGAQAIGEVLAYGASGTMDLESAAILCNVLEQIGDKRAKQFLRHVLPMLGFMGELQMRRVEDFVTRYGEGTISDASASAGEDAPAAYTILEYAGTLGDGMTATQALALGRLLAQINEVHDTGDGVALLPRMLRLADKMDAAQEDFVREYAARFGKGSDDGKDSVASIQSFIAARGGDLSVKESALAASALVRIHTDKSFEALRETLEGKNLPPVLMVYREVKDELAREYRRDDKAGEIARDVLHRAALREKGLLPVLDTIAFEVILENEGAAPAEGAPAAPPRPEVIIGCIDQHLTAEVDTGDNMERVGQSREILVKFGDYAIDKLWTIALSPDFSQYPELHRINVLRTIAYMAEGSSSEATKQKARECLMEAVRNRDLSEGVVGSAIKVMKTNVIAALRKLIYINQSKEFQRRVCAILANMGEAGHKQILEALLSRDIEERLAGATMQGLMLVDNHRSWRRSH